MNTSKAVSGAARMSKKNPMSLAAQANLQKWARSFKKELSELGWKLYVKFLKPVMIKKVRNPEKIIKFTFEEFAPASENLIATALSYSLNAAKPTPERIIVNYCQGAVLFGKHNSGNLVWKIPSERSVISKESAHIPKKVRKIVKQNKFEVRFDRDFETILRSCRREKGTWITESLQQHYIELFKSGFAWSAGAYEGNRLLAGSWGIRIGGIYAGMSTFTLVSDAGSVLLAALVEKIIRGEVVALDCGAPKPHFEKFGAKALKSENFIEKVAQCLNFYHPS